LCPPQGGMPYENATYFVVNTADLWACPQKNCGMYKPKRVNYQRFI